MPLFLDLEMCEMLVGDADPEARQIIVKLQIAVFGIRVASEDIIKQPSSRALLKPSRFKWDFWEFGKSFCSVSFFGGYPPLNL